MNNKGQTLVVFILLLPLMVLLLSFVINQGYVYVAKRELQSNIKESINMRFNLDESSDIDSKIRNYFIKNVDDIKSLDIKISPNYIKITVMITVKAQLPMIIDKSEFEIESSYEGNLRDDKIIISKE
ncbi:MAG: pilus assembly protein TadG-related protein [Bacilli bacterium]